MSEEITVTFKVRKLGLNEVICFGDLHSFGDKTYLETVKDSETYGQVPDDFYKDRDFYRLITAMEKVTPLIDLPV